MKGMVNEMRSMTGLNDDKEKQHHQLKQSKISLNSKSIYRVVETFDQLGLPFES